LLRGLGNTVLIALGAYGVGIVLGTLGAFGKLYGGALTRDLLGLYTTMVRAIPELVLILILYFAVTDLVNQALLAMGYERIQISGVAAGIMVLGVVQGAYATEVLRGAIQSVPAGQIEAARAQLATEGARATGSGKQSDRLGELAIEFKGLEMRAEFALDAYKLALAAVENARIDATRKLKSLSVIEPPTLPQTAEYPRRLYNLTTLLVACLLIYGIVRLIIATIREHQD
jgi:His/Glu/Gln/Arg/opine family amino acid ABC transporter permease subunit